MKEINNLILRLTTFLDQLESQLDERHRLKDILKLEPSSNDNYEVITQLSKIVKSLGYLQDDIINQEITNELVISKFKELHTKYEQLTGDLEDDSLNIEDYRFEAKPLPKVSKTVRFTDDQHEDNEDELRNQLMGTHQFKPFKDDPEEVGNLSNHQMFAKHQQQLLKQDEDLDILHGSVKIQRNMGLTINDEIENHLIMLNDLEQGVESSQLRLDSTSNRLKEFRTKVEENGSLVTIVTLTIILIVLLVVLN